MPMILGLVQTQTDSLREIQEEVEKHSGNDGTTPNKLGPGVTHWRHPTAHAEGFLVDVKALGPDAKFVLVYLRQT